MTHHTLFLRRGESRLLRVPPGSRWRTARGSVHLAEPPRWLGERIVQIEATLRPGHAHVVDAGGWVALQALDNSEIDWHVPASTWARWRALCRIIRPGRAGRVAA